jgi:tetratricopeptide (TPR) repeat protein
MKPTATEQLNRLLDQARRDMDLGDAGAACGLASRVLRQQPDHVEGRLVHAEALLQLNRPDEAIASLDALELYLGDPQSQPQLNRRMEGLLLRAEALGRLKQLSESGQVLSDVLDAQPTHPRALRRLANLLMNLKRYDQAIAVIKKLRSLQPADVQLLRMLAEAYERIDCADLALGIYQQLDALRDAEASAPAGQLRQARLRRAARQLRHAADAYAQLMREEPEDAQLACEAAELSIELGDDEAATDYLDLALRQRPRHEQAMTMLGQQHMRCGRFAAAGRLWWRLWRADPTRAEAMAGLVVCALCENHNELAERAAGQLARLERTTGRRALLVKMWQLAVPGRLVQHMWQRAGSREHAQALDCLLDEAAETFEQQINDQPGFADLHYHLAVCQRELGHDDLAGESLDRALHINRHYTAAIRQRVELLLDQRCYSAASALLDASMDRADKARQVFDLWLLTCAMSGEVDSALSALCEQVSDADRRKALAEQIEAELERRGHTSALGAWRAAAHRHLSRNIDPPIQPQAA